MKALIVILVLGVALSAAQRRTSCNCGWRRPTGRRIVGGVESGVNEWPSIVALLEEDAAGRVGQFCGGTIISQKHVLTAAHCIRSVNKDTNEISDKMAGNLRVLIKGHDLRNLVWENLLAVSNVEIHELYNHDNLDNDIAIITVRDNIPFSDIVGPVCLPTARLNLDDVEVTAVGWGATAWGADGKPVQTPLLHKVDLTAFNVNNCIQKWPATHFDTNNIHQLCTYNPGRSICPGDSGGPLYWLDPEINRYVLAGITSFVPRLVLGQQGCQQLSGFNDPSAFTEWIGARLGNEAVCFKI